MIGAFNVPRFGTAELNVGMSIVVVLLVLARQSLTNHHKLRADTFLFKVLFDPVLCLKRNRRDPLTLTLSPKPFVDAWICKMIS